MNSNSGVAFSPPSIVKDTLGDSGMLLETETISHSPDASTSQVSCFKKLRERTCAQDIIYENIKGSHGKFHSEKIEKLSVVKPASHLTTYELIFNTIFNFTHHVWKNLFGKKLSRTWLHREPDDFSIYSSR